MNSPTRSPAPRSFASRTATKCNPRVSALTPDEAFVARPLRRVQRERRPARDVDGDVVPASIELGDARVARHGASRGAQCGARRRAAPHSPTLDAARDATRSRGMAPRAARAPRASTARVGDARSTPRARRARENLDAARRRRRGVARASVADDALERARATALEATATIDLSRAEGAGRRAVEAARAAAASADAAEAAASAATWDALERAARTATAAFDAVVDGDAIDAASTLVKALTDALEGLPAIDRERFATDGAALLESLPKEASELANEAARSAGSIAAHGGGVILTPALD